MRPRSFAPLRYLLAGTLLHGVVAATAPAPSFAQDAFARARRFTVDDGLAENRVPALLQDRAGFVWAGTWRGLQRFDGYSFTRAASLVASAPRELSSNIFGLLLERRGKMVVVTARDPDIPGVLCCAFFLSDSAVTSVTRLPVTGNVWTLDSDGGLWVLDGGALKRVSLDDPTTVQTVAENALWTQCSAFTVSNGIAWLGMRGQKAATVTRFVLSTGESRTFRAESATLPHDIDVTTTGRVWLVADDGLEVLEQGSEKFRALDEFRARRPTNLIPDTSGGFFVATDYWLARMDSTGNLVERWTSPDVFGVGVLPTRLAIDREGGVWLASVTGGIMRLDLRKPSFEYRSSRSVPPLLLANDFITAVLERADGALWVSTFRGGVYRISRDWTQVHAFRHDPRDSTSIAADEVWDIEEDSRGNIWVATTGAICKALGDRFRCIRPPNVRRFGVTDIARDTGGWFWIANGPAGILSFDPISERFGSTIPTPDELVGIVPASIFHDSTHLWMGLGSLYRVRVQSGQVLGPLEKVRSGRSAQLFYHFHRDRHGVLWVGSTDGLHRLSSNSPGESFAPVDVPELRGTMVYSIAEDTSGLLWLGTTHGLVRYSPTTGMARRYGRADGFRSGELNRRAAIRRHTGEMLFGGVEGLTQFDPTFVTSPSATAPVAITHWSKLTARGPVHARIDGLRALRIEPHDLAFTIEFAALSFAPDVGRRYRYRVDGLNSDWVETTDHSATYSTPRPGRYVFRVQTAVGSDGTWSTPGLTVSIDVVPPYWATWWFGALVALAVSALLWVAHRMRLRQALATERVRSQISRDLHDEIGAGLSSIALLSDSVGASGEITERDRTQLQRIAHSARDMVADLRDIVWAIDPEDDRLEDVLTRMRDVASDLLRGVEVSFHSPPAHELADKITMFARRDLLLLFKELLHNITRHSRATVVRIDVTARRGHFELVVSDNGVGFDPSDVRRGTGLKSIRQRAARLGGTLEISSEPAGGTTARLTVDRT